MNEGKGRYGKRATTEWRDFCISHLDNCDDEKCHIRSLMRIWNENNTWFHYSFPEDKIQSSASTVRNEK